MPERSATHSPLVQVVFTMQDEDAPELTLPGAVVRPVPPGDAPLDMDLLLSVRKVAAGLEVRVDFNHDVFDARTARRLAAHLETLLASAAGDPDGLAGAAAHGRPGRAGRADRPGRGHRPRAPRRGASSTSCSSARRRAHPTPSRWCTATNSSPTRGWTARPTRSPTACASWAWARNASSGSSPSGPLETFVSVLAVLKAGGAFLPLDPVQPPLRLRHMLTERRGRRALGAASDDWTASTVVDPRGLEPRADAPPCDAHPESLAYVHYTSGSTGLPKGVAHSHAAMAALMGWDGEDIPVRPGGSVLQYNARSPSTPRSWRCSPPGRPGPG